MIEPILPGISIRLIQRLVADHFKVAHHEMTSASRCREVARPRQVAMALAAEFLPHKGWSTIAYHFGGRDHATLFHARRAVARRERRDPETRAALAELRAAIEAHRPQAVQLDLDLAA